MPKSGAPLIVRTRYANNTGARLRRVLLLAGALVLAVGLISVPAAGASAASSQADDGTVESTGAGGIGPDPYQPPAELLPALKAKQAQVDALDAQLDSGGALPACGGATTCAPTSYALPNLVIHKEGEGDGKKSYTCGPAATRNMIQTLTGRNITEATYATWEKTTSSNGTYIGDIASALNTHFSTTGSWAVYAMTSTTLLKGYVINDTYTDGMGIIEHVDTGYLSFFNGKHLGHYDMIYGYSSSGGYIKIAEEWDPIYVHGSSSYGNPFGTHSEPVANVYSAIRHSNSQSIVG